MRGGEGGSLFAFYLLTGKEEVVAYLAGIALGGRETGGVGGGNSLTLLPP